MIKIGKTEIQLNLTVQTSTEGRQFKMSGVGKIGEPKWINGALKSKWVWHFKFLDDGSFFTIESDYDGKNIKYFYERDVIVMNWFNRTKLLPNESIIDNSVGFINKQTGISKHIISKVIDKNIKYK